jgi:hypothetical protein
MGHIDGRTSPTSQQSYDDETTNDTNYNDQLTHDTNHDQNAETSPIPNTKYYEEFHPNVPLIFGSGPGFMDIFDADNHNEKRKENLYYPFSLKGEWGIALWLLSSGLSMRAIDDFLSLPIVSSMLCMISLSLTKKKIQQLSLSFSTAKMLHTHMEDLPKAPKCVFKLSSGTRPLRVNELFPPDESTRVLANKTVSTVIG